MIPGLDVPRALRRLGEDFEQLLHDAPEPDARAAAARVTTLKNILGIAVTLLRLVPRDPPSPLDLGALRAAIAQEIPHDDEAEGEPG